MLGLVLAGELFIVVWGTTSRTSFSAGQEAYTTPFSYVSCPFIRLFELQLAVHALQGQGDIIR